jgi:hypothetical protein
VPISLLLFLRGGGARVGITIDDVARVVRSELALVRSEIAPLRKGLNAALATMMDPWENIRSIQTDAMKSASAEHVDVVVAFYGTPKQHHCMVLGKATHCDIICAHLWPKHTYGQGLDSYNLKAEDVNSPRNFLRLHKDIERAFDHKRLYFEHTATTGTLNLRVRVVDPDLLRSTFEASERPVTFASIDNKEFAWSFAADKIPFRRLLAAHALKAIDVARARNWIADDADANARRTRNLELARYSLGEGSTVLSAFFSSDGSLR